MQNEDELLDLVDAADNVIGTILRTEAHKQGLHNFRSIHAFLRRSDGKLWISRRAAHKIIAPLALDASVSGHVSSGESYQQGLFREALEELNIDVHTLPFREIAYLTPTKHNVFCFERVYEIDCNSEPSFNPSDIVEGYWLTPAEVRQRIKQGETCKSDLPTLFEILYVEDE